MVELSLAWASLFLKNPIFPTAGKHPVAESAGQGELGISWKQEYLVAENPEDGRLVCMVCGGLLSSSGPAAARQHILQQHAHSLDFTLEEKHNILEGWSEGAVLPEIESAPSSAGKPLPALPTPTLRLLWLRCPRGSGRPMRRRPGAAPADSDWLSGPSHPRRSGREPAACRDRSPP